MIKKQSKIKLDYHRSNYKNTSSSQNKNSQLYYYNVVKKRKKMFFLILLLVCLIASFNFLFFSPYFDIQNFEISKTQSISQEEIKKIVEDQTKQRRFFLFNQKNFFLFNTKKLQDSLNQKYNLNKLKILKEFKNSVKVTTIKIDLEEKISTLILITPDDKCYFLDEQGTALKEIISNNLNIKTENENDNQKKCAPEILSEKFKKIPIIYNETEKNIEIKKTIISKKIIQSVLFLYKELPLKTNIKINFFKIPILKKLDLAKEKEKITEKSKDEKNLEEEYKKLEKTEIRVATKDGFEIYFDIFFSDLNQQINNLRKVLNQEIKNKTSSLEYIDLRFGNRIYYKVKE
ncbi:hypothetical protein CVV26_01885 [Candidatus Kuenenbacteria bacterium HGW-Kuenenbacteria-1]|uniref:POTRA domain-containing protein n=1 Tax=Candidatus Kuenenbacteria bacterium HGW-Kuenenbacteria-1 TaxID=2013812 RepID=A0A2N1UNI0_9BACT|nr:MAG: hypothetical protein CVV26_01885 [Candidatus Kuenenbacteria bacterium HGW-Kuenenbacteria-1]